MNTKKEHTPGPMDIVKVALETARIDEMMESASMELDWSDTPDSDREENENRAVAILRAAPELLAALAATLEDMESGALWDNSETRAAAFQNIRAAIAKAKGE